MSTERTSLGQHKMHKRKLTPPLKGIPNLNLTSWTNDRLPEYLHAALLITHLSRDDGLKKFRKLVDLFTSLEEETVPKDLSLTSLGSLDEEEVYNLLKDVFDTEELKNIIRPLLLFKEIPGYSVWERIINSEPEEEDWEKLKFTIGKTFFHQSQEATDIRWFCLLFALASGKLEFGSGMEHLEDELWYYPHEGLMEKVMPFIRATEVSLCQITNLSEEWITNFWKRCFLETNTEILVEIPKEKYKIDDKLLSEMKFIEGKLIESFYSTIDNSNVNAKHDAAFGLVMYSFSILSDSLKYGIGNSLIGRIVLRSLVENYITLSYLIEKDEDDLWKSYRAFGIGDVKLISLKADNFNSTPSFMDTEDLMAIANEDIWEEFVEIELGHWNNTNLRKMSMESDTKDIYDKYNDWTSGYVHGSWGAVRNSVYTTDFNPLHRLMRVPFIKRDFNDVIHDMIEILNLQLSILANLYNLDELNIKIEEDG